MSYYSEAQNETDRVIRRDKWTKQLITRLESKITNIDKFTHVTHPLTEAIPKKVVKSMLTDILKTVKQIDKGEE